MRNNHQNLWAHEHKTTEGIPSLAFPEASECIYKMLEYAKKHKINFGKKVLDIGCGKGRDSIYLAQKGYDVSAFDFVPEAIDFLKQRAIREHVYVKSNVARMDKSWLYKQETFDLIIDDTASMSIDTLEGRTICRNETFRTLKKGGYAIVYVISADDEFENTFPKGTEHNTVIWEGGRVEKLYTSDEIKTFYSRFITIDQIEMTSVDDNKYGKNWVRKTIWNLFQKRNK